MLIYAWWDEYVGFPHIFTKDCIDLFIDKCIDVLIVGIVWIPWSIEIDCTFWLIVSGHVLIGVLVTVLNELTVGNGVYTSVPLEFSGMSTIIFVSTGWKLLSISLCDTLGLTDRLGPLGNLGRHLWTFMGAPPILCVAYLSHSVQVPSVCYTHSIFTFIASALTFWYAADSDLLALICL